MERYFKRKEPLQSPISTIHNEPSKQSRVEIDLPELQADPGLRPRIMDYDPNIREQVKRAYLLKGPCQPRRHDFPQRDFSVFLRRFNTKWFNEFSSWLEYSMSKDAVFCLYCYLFKTEVGDQGDCFVGNGFTNSKKRERLQMHDGSVNSAHRQAKRRCQDLLNQKQHIETIFFKVSDEAKRDYKIQLTASIDCARFLLRQGLSFREHDESELSNNQGNFLELLKFLSLHIHLADCFALVSNIVNVVGASCKHRDTLREKQATKIIEALSKGYVASGRGLNQGTIVIRANDTRWGSHYGTLLSLVIMFSSVIDELEVIVVDATTSEQKLEAFRLLKEMQSFEFAFNLHLMKSTLGITNELSQTLQRKDQDIVNAMKQVQVSKQRLQSMRENG